jgi:Flp pilus assembly protein TadD
MNFTADLLRIAEDILAGELAAAEGDFDTAVARLESAVEGEYNLNYDEPPPWHFPVRQALGAVLLEAGRFADAERVYREDLERFPENGWSLFGLHKSLTAQGKEGEAETVRQRFGQAWQYADVTLKTSRI